MDPACNGCEGCRAEVARQMFVPFPSFRTITNDICSSNELGLVLTLVDPVPYPGRCCRLLYVCNTRECLDR